MSGNTIPEKLRQAELLWGYSVDANVDVSDDNYLGFGTDNDIRAGWDNTNSVLEFLPSTDDTGAVNIGDGTTDCDFKVFLGATTAYAEFNVGDGQVNIEGAELHLGDSDEIEFGDGNDVTMQWDGTDFHLGVATNNSVINVGNGTLDADLKWFCADAGDYVQIDASGAVMNFIDVDLTVDDGHIQLHDNDPIYFGDTITTDPKVSYNSTRGALVTDPLGYYVASEGASDRFSLKWVAGQRGKPSINADILDATEATRMIADPDFEVLGTNATSAQSTFYAEGGITLTTAGAVNDQTIIAPHLDANQSPWTQITWGTDKEVRWECDLTTGSSIDETTFWAGLKLTNTDTTATDNDQAFFRYQNGVNSGKWQAVSSIGGSDDAHDSGVTLAADTRYHLVIDIASDRTAKFYINGALVETSAALTDAVDLIPYVGVMNSAGAGAAEVLYVHSQSISRTIG